MMASASIACGDRLNVIGNRPGLPCVPGVAEGIAIRERSAGRPRGRVPGMAALEEVH